MQSTFKIMEVQMYYLKHIKNNLIIFNIKSKDVSNPYRIKEWNFERKDACYFFHKKEYLVSFLFMSLCIWFLI